MHPETPHADDTISLILPIYNVETYLGYCLDSILIQKTQATLEIICVNDGSTDKSGEILQSYARKDTRIKLITQNNQGVSAARNKGIEAATGAYLLFFDPDDVMHPQYLELMEKAMRESPCDFVWCNFMEIQQEEQPYFSLYEKKGQHELYQAPFLRYFHGQSPCPYACIWNKIMKREIVDSLRFHPSLSIGEDFLFTMQYLYQTQQACHIPLDLIAYRKRENSALHAELSRAYIDKHVAFIFSLLAEFKDKPLSKKLRKRFVAKMVKILLKSLIQIPYNRAGADYQAYWIHYSHILHKTIEEGIFQRSDLSCKGRLIYYLFTHQKFTLLKLFIKKRTKSLAHPLHRPKTP